MLTALSTDLLPIIHSLFCAAAGKSAWKLFLSELRTGFDAKAAQIVRVSARHSELTFNAMLGFEEFLERRYGDPRDGLENARARYQQHFTELMDDDPRIRLLIRHPNQPISCRLALDQDELRSSRAYRELLDVADVEYSLVVNLPDADGSSIMMGVFRGKDGSYFTTEDVDRLRALLPFVKQAVLSSEEFSRLQLEQDMSADLLDGMALAIFVLNRSMRIHYVNARAKALLVSHDGLTGTGGVLRLLSRPEHDVLRAAVSTACDGPSRGHKLADALTISRDDGLQPLSAIVVPKVARSAGTALCGNSEPMAAVFIAAPEPCEAETRTTIGHMFGLTPAQARLCEVLTTGISLEAAAELLNITPQTARTHLKRIFIVLGVNRQSELVAKILRTPVGMLSRN